MRVLERLLLALAADADAADREIDWFAQLDAIGDGDREALARVRRLVTAQLIRSSAYRHRDSWDDFAQEVIVRVWRAYSDGKIREAPAVPAFVRTTTRNAFVDWARKHRREIDLPDEELTRDLAEPDPERRLDPGLELVLRNAVDALEERHQDVVRCLYLEGLSYDETAARLERPRGTINRLQREAMAQLRGRLLAEEAEQ